MDSTFMTIHNLSSDANILFASDSIYDILGYQPRDVEGRSCFDFFHPEEVPLARYVHGRGVLMDKAAALHYARIRNVHGQWVGCECTFSVVHDILVACTSIYHHGEKSERRAQDAPQVRRLFSSPQDPRYHMLGHLAPKFTMAPPDRELRAALIINRFTRSLAIMFATTSVAEVLGLEPSELQQKSFYDCIQDNCLDDAMECIEAAKANDSIAYLRFWSRDARRPDEVAHRESSSVDGDLSGDTLAGGSSGSGEGPSNLQVYSNQASHSPIVDRDSTPRRNSSESEQGGVRLDAGMDLDSPAQSASPIKREPMSEEPAGASIAMNDGESGGMNSHHVSTAQSSASDTANAVNQGHDNGTSPNQDQRRGYPVPSVEIEAFISCTSDGLVVILRRARELPRAAATSTAAETNRQGIFAAPWAAQPVAAHYGRDAPHDPQMHHVSQASPVPVQQKVEVSGGPPVDALMASIQEVAVFAWALVGINRNLSTYSHGNPVGEAQPAEDSYYNEKLSDTVMPCYSTTSNGNHEYSAAWGAPTQYLTNDFALHEKGQPIEPRYTSYPEQGANQLRSNGPWSNGNGVVWHGQQPNDNHMHTNGYVGEQPVANFDNGMNWDQASHNYQDGNGNGNRFH